MEGLEVITRLYESNQKDMLKEVCKQCDIYNLQEHKLKLKPVLYDLIIATGAIHSYLEQYDESWFSRYNLIPFRYFNTWSYYIHVNCGKECRLYKEEIDKTLFRRLYSHKFCEHHFTPIDDTNSDTDYESDCYNDSCDTDHESD